MFSVTIASPILEILPNEASTSGVLSERSFQHNTKCFDDQEFKFLRPLIGLIGLAEKETTAFFWFSIGCKKKMRLGSFKMIQIHSVGVAP